MEQTFYVIVTERDCDAQVAARHNQHPNGPIVFECYLNEFARDEARVRKHASAGFKKYGWVRVGKLTVDMPGALDDTSARAAEAAGDSEAAIEIRAAAWRKEQNPQGD